MASVPASSTTAQGRNSDYSGGSVVHATGSYSRHWWSEVAAAPEIEDVNGGGWREGLIGNFFKRALDVGSSDESGRGKRPQPQHQPQPQPQPQPPSFLINNLPSDRADRPRITSYHPNQRDEIRRIYWIKGPSQPKGHDFPSIKIGNKNIHFVKEWFDEFNWLEYSTKENKAYCLCCYLFGDIVGQQGGEIFLLKNMLTFRGHDESDGSLSKGLFIEQLSFLRDHNESIYNVTLQNAPKNEKLTSPKIQKEIVQCFSKEIIKSICEEIGKDVFAILVDESSDERFVGVVHVKDTSSLTLKEAIDSGFTNNNLSISQLVVVAVAKNHDGAKDFFEQLALVVNVVCASCKRKDIIRESYKERVQKEIGNGEIDTGRGLNQEISLVRVGDTRWSSHYKTITSLKNLFPEVVKVLNYVEEEGSSLHNRNQAYGILSYFKTLDFVFYLHLMLEIFGLTDTLSRHLQKKDQDILEAASLVKVTMKTLKALRNNGFPSILEKVFSFCQKHKIKIVEMSECYVTPRNRRTKITNQHHFEVDIFNTVLDMQI
ncbi:uncharacterized protein LOC111891158 [Lactuca sativa]|uniref:uncharacterized protein LOC111891158 n=1 Tax=Lactuca sativa TaxID=4236 RepID=UPI0022AE95BE|nr:uncharacterized protein LOC111891158 [Lactuca sativa]